MAKLTLEMDTRLLEEQIEELAENIGPIIDDLEAKAASLLEKLERIAALKEVLG